MLEWQCDMGQTSQKTGRTSGTLAPTSAKPIRHGCQLNAFFCCCRPGIASRTGCYNPLVSIPFEVEAISGSARLGRLTTPHGVVETPVFMPVGTVASVKGVSQDILEELGVQILLGNTYHLYLRPGVEQVRQLGGLHRFMAWPRAILTDSGGFQVFSLNELRKVTEEGVTFRSHLDGSSHFFSPESAMEAQIGLGADIIMAFDECTEHPADRERVRQSMEMTLRWAERSKKYFEEHKHEVPWSTDHVGAGVLACPGERKLAGSLQQRTLSMRPVKLPSCARLGRRGHLPLRGPRRLRLFSVLCRAAWMRRSERNRPSAPSRSGFLAMRSAGLSVGEPRALTREIVEATLQHLPADKPRYLMGVGTPEEIVEYASLGVDMMDCVLPTRAARHGLAVYFRRQRFRSSRRDTPADQGPLDPNCGCRVCRRYSRAYLRHLYAANEVLAQVLNTVHNLSFYLDTMRAVRHSIALGNRAQLLSGEQSRAKP